MKPGFGQVYWIVSNKIESISERGKQFFTLWGLSGFICGSYACFLRPDWDICYG